MAALQKIQGGIRMDLLIASQHWTPLPAGQRVLKKNEAAPAPHSLSHVCLHFPDSHRVAHAHIFSSCTGHRQMRRLLYPRSRAMAVLGCPGASERY